METIINLISNHQNQLIIGAVSLIIVIYIISRRIKQLLEMFKGFLNWVRPSFEGQNKTASSRRLSAFSIITVYIICRFVFVRNIEDPYYLLLALIIDALFALLLFGIVTFQQVISLKETFKKEITEIRSKIPQQDLKKLDDQLNEENMNGMM